MRDGGAGGSGDGKQTADLGSAAERVVAELQAMQVPAAHRHGP